tara:strand:- start:240 stop:383 length:144 start_codon:yes stop_codon:yes gene_type:complete
MIYEKRGRWVWETGTGRRKFSTKEEAEKAAGIKKVSVKKEENASPKS